VLKVRDVPALGYDHPGGAGDVTSGRGGKLHEVTECGGVRRLRLGHLLARLQHMAAHGALWVVRLGLLLDVSQGFRDAVARFSPDIVHVHNVFPLLSPSIYWAAARGGIPK